jgi:lysine-N-methylase
MPHTVLRNLSLSTFSCLGDKCEDTCCQTWSMQVDEGTIERYRSEAPELLAAVESAKETPWIMRKDASTGFCIKLQGGLCAIHKERGDSFLGDACHFYPRMTRQLGNRVVMDASLSCPEITRLALFATTPDKREEVQVERLPYTMRDYLPADITSDDALQLHDAFVQTAGDTSFPVEEAFTRIASVARSIERVDQRTWPQATAFYLKNVGMWIPMAEPNPLDPFNLLHALCGLIVATQKPLRGRLKETLDDMEKALAVTLDWDKAAIDTSEHSAGALERLRILWNEEGAKDAYDDVLRRYLQMQLTEGLFPFAGMGASPSERITFIGVRLATIKLALMCSCAIHGNNLPQEVVVRVIQSISRILDHLADPGFSLQIYAETGWVKEGRMRALLEM